MNPLPTLYKRTSTGAIQQWTISVEATSVGAVDTWGVITTTYGQLGGKQQVATDIIREGKNIGRANETSAVEQAHAEAQSQWETKLKKGYVKSIEEAREGKRDSIIAGGVDPMLAHSYEKHGHKISFPAYVQPKLDGHRCIAVVQGGKASLWSRTRKRITGVPHIERELEARFPDETLVLDGELYNHSYREKFEQLTSLIRSQTPKPNHTEVQYWVYDIVGDKPQTSRLRRLAFLGQRIGASIVLVPTESVANEEEMIAVFGAYIENGFEGLMVRNARGRYKGSRSYDLQKVKVFADAEYELVRIEAGKGKMADKAVFVCVTETGEEFKCKLVGKLDDLKKYLEDPEPWIGRMVTVKYQNLSEKGVPRFGVAMRFREDV